MAIALEKPELNMKNDDIYGTRPNVMKDTIKTKRVTNPLAPQYELCKVDECPATPPKFLRDGLKNDVLIKVTLIRILMEPSQKSKMCIHPKTK
jgi:hypothetical protein